MYSTIDHSWFQTNTAQRSVGVLGSLIITTFFLLQFQSELKIFKKNIRSSNSELQLIWIPSLKKNVENEPIAPKIKITQEQKKIKVPRTLISIPITTSIESKVGVGVGVGAEKETTLLISPKSDLTFDETPKLIFDSKSIRRAYEDSKTDIQKMAEASGKPLIKTAHSSQQEQFQSAANRAAKPDCIGPKTGGAGLLAIFIIPVMAAMDKCK